MDFSHWNMAQDFSLFEVACLACGIEPSENINDPRVKSVERLLNEAYLRCRTTCWSILQQNDRELLAGSEPTYPKMCVDAFEAWMELPSRDLRSSFGEALQDPENRTLFSMEEDRMRFGRDDLERFFKDCEYEPNVLLYNAIRRPSSEHQTQRSSHAQNKNDIDKPLLTRERDNLLKLVIGMAIEGYSYDPSAAKSVTSKEIADDLTKLGMPISDDTVRKYLKQAVEIVLPAISTKR